MIQLTLNISQLTSKALRKGKYKDVIPEIYALDAYIENGPYHDHQSVFDHIVKSLSGLELLLSDKSPISKKIRINIGNYLAKSIGNQVRSAILYAAILLHDSGKGATFIKDDLTGISSCPGHEFVGANEAWNFQDRLGFDNPSMTALEKIIRCHGFMSEMFNSAYRTGEIYKFYQLAKQGIGNVTGETLLQMFTDDLGSDLEKNDTLTYGKRAEVIMEFIRFHFKETD